MAFRLSHRAKRALHRLPQEWTRLDGGLPGAEHVLLALLRDSRATAVLVLGEMGVDPNYFRKVVEKRVIVNPPPKVGSFASMQQSGGVSKVLMDAGEQAKDLGHPLIGTEHLLLAILSSEGSTAHQVLADHWIVGADFRRALIDYRVKHPSVEERIAGSDHVNPWEFGVNVIRNPREALAEIEERLEGDTNNVLLRMNRGDALKRLERPEEALSDYLFCFDEGRDYQGFYGVRLSFLLGRIKELGTEMPEAMEALEERAASAYRELLSNNRGFHIAHDLSCLNEYLGRNERSLEALDHLRDNGCEDSAAMDILFIGSVDELLENGRYRDVCDGAGERILDLDWAATCPRDPSRLLEDDDSGLSLSQRMRQQPVVNAARFYEALLGVGEDTMAEQLCFKLLDQDPSAGTYAILASTAARVERYDLARDFLERGFSRAGRNDCPVLLQANANLPQGERYDPPG